MTINMIARELAEEIERLPAPEAPIRVALPEADEEPVRAPESIGYAEGQSFAIEYVDSAGKLSARRITVWSIIGGSGGVPCLLAFCHERRAQRQFRIDRIQCFIDYDGEVHVDVPQFLVDNFGMALPLAHTKSADDARWAGILSLMRHDAVLLAALARSDGRTRPEEVEVELDYLSRLVERSGLMLSDGEIAAIGRYAGRLRPSEDAILRALDHLVAQGDTRIKRLLVAAMQVIDADGKRHPKEIAMVNAIAQDLTGAPLM